PREREEAAAGHAQVEERRAKHGPADAQPRQEQQGAGGGSGDGADAVPRVERGDGSAHRARTRSRPELDGQGQGGPQAARGQQDPRAGDQDLQRVEPRRVAVAPPEDGQEEYGELLREREARERPEADAELGEAEAGPGSEPRRTGAGEAAPPREPQE